MTSDDLGPVLQRFPGETNFARFLIGLGMVVLIVLPTISVRGNELLLLRCVLAILAGVPAIGVGLLMQRVELTLYRDGVTYRGYLRRVSIRYDEIESVAMVRGGSLRLVVLELHDGRRIPLRGLTQAARAAGHITELMVP